MADKITTVPRARLGERIGTLTPTAMAPVNRAMMVFLGLAGSARG
jgi:mRNA interferase MazF